MIQAKLQNNQLITEGQGKTFTTKVRGSGRYEVTYATYEPFYTLKIGYVTVTEQDLKRQPCYLPITYPK